MKEIIGIDIGGTKISFGLVRIFKNRQKVINYFRVATPKERKKILKVLVEGIKKLDNKKVKAIGIGIPGTVDHRKGIIKLAVNLGTLNNLNLKKILERKIKKKVFIDNDANCFALAEYKFGQAKNKKIVLGITLGTGIGGGLVTNGKIFHGSNYGLEIGHMTVEPKGRKCNCGNKGCFEQYTSGPAIAKKYKELTGKEKEPLEIEKMAKKDKFANMVYQEAGYYLGIALANLINIFHPEIIVVGGSIARAKILYKPALKELKKRVLFFGKKIPIKRSKLDYYSAVLGAAYLADNLYEN